MTAKAHGKSETTISAAVEGELRDIVRGVPRKRPDQSVEIADGELPLIASIAAAPLREIERLISELQESRNFLGAEAERIDREVARYRELSAGALEAAKIVTSHMGDWTKKNQPTGDEVAGA